MRLYNQKYPTKGKYLGQKDFMIDIDWVKIFTLWDGMSLFFVKIRDTLF